MQQFLRRRSGRLLRSALIVAGGACITAATWAVFRHGVERPEKGLPILGTVPQFELIASNGARLSQANLTGTIWVADFIFTQCPGLCPVLSGQMAKVQRAVARASDGGTRLVSFSVDPAHDTPTALRAYAERFGADPDRWLFLTGDRDALYRLIGEGFRLAVADRPENADGEGLITHSDRFVLVDGALHIRGYYHGTDTAEMGQLVRDITALNAEQSAAGAHASGAAPG